eukprot:COSAG04_NODE_2390_length_4219_cov_2.436165_2_plen_139_part_00
MRALLLLLPAAATALDNGFVKPALGWSSWYAAPMGSQVTDAFVRASAKSLISSGLAKKGYKYVNVDEGWLKGRHAGNNTICASPPCRRRGWSSSCPSCGYRELLLLRSSQPPALPTAAALTAARCRRQTRTSSSSRRG